MAVGTTNVTLTSAWQKIADYASGNTDVLVTFASGWGAEIAVATSEPSADLVGHPLNAKGEGNRFEATLITGQQVWARNRGNKTTVLTLTK